MLTKHTYTRPVSRGGGLTFLPGSSGKRTFKGTVCLVPLLGDAGLPLRLSIPCVLHVIAGVPAGTTYLIRCRTGLAGSLTWSGSPEWGSWSPTQRFKTKGDSNVGCVVWGRGGRVGKREGVGVGLVGAVFHIMHVVD